MLAFKAQASYFSFSAPAACSTSHQFWTCFSRREVKRMPLLKKPQEERGGGRTYLLGTNVLRRGLLTWHNSAFVFPFGEARRKLEIWPSFLHEQPAPFDLFTQKELLVSPNDFPLFKPKKIRIVMIRNFVVSIFIHQC